MRPIGTLLVPVLLVPMECGSSCDRSRTASPATFPAVAIMVVLTTLVTPPALKWSLAHPRPRPPRA